MKPSIYWTQCSPSVTLRTPEGSRRVTAQRSEDVSSQVVPKVLAVAAPVAGSGARRGEFADESASLGSRLPTRNREREMEREGERKREGQERRRGEAQEEKEAEEVAGVKGRNVRLS